MSESDDEMRRELERLKAENEALKAKERRGTRLQVSEKGGVSLYGMRRFPITFYKEEWERILELADEIRALATTGLHYTEGPFDRERFVDESGHPVSLPEPGSGRAWTAVDRDGRRVAAIVHDAALDATPELVTAAASAASLALDNERLKADLQARVEELRVSLFAQQLKTPVPISVKRMVKMWQSMRNR